MKCGVKQILNVTLVLFIFSFSCAAAFGQSANQVSLEKMYAFALKELPQILKFMPKNTEERYGFNNRDEFKRASLGIPYQEYSMQTEEPTGFWRVPVTVDGENRALLRLIRVEGEWKFSGFGGAVLARDLGKLEKEAGQARPSGGRIIRDFEMTCDYVQFDRAPGSKPDGLVIPLESAVRVLRHLGIADSIGAHGIPLSMIQAYRSMVLKPPVEKDETGKEK
jgi:hypothetical protein